MSPQEQQTRMQLEDLKSTLRQLEAHAVGMNELVGAIGGMRAAGAELVSAMCAWFTVPDAGPAWDRYFECQRQQALTASKQVSEQIEKVKILIAQGEDLLSRQASPIILPRQ